MALAATSVRPVIPEESFESRECRAYIWRSYRRQDRVMLSPILSVGEIDAFFCIATQGLEKMNSLVAVSVKWMAARIVAAPAFVMPYKMRAVYISALSSLIHFPLRAFGKLAKYLLDELKIEALPDQSPPMAPPQHPFHGEEMSKNHLPGPGNGASRAEQAVVIYSGGSDSTCAAALIAPLFKKVYLVTYSEYATRKSPIPVGNAARLKAAFPETVFDHRVFGIDGLVRYFSFYRYLFSLAKFGLVTLSTCGYSSLSWHIRTIDFCLKNGISHVYDGLTRELMHFPGHMDEVVSLYRDLYQRFGIAYESPVREWPVPQDQQFIDRVLVNRHQNDFFIGDKSRADRKTTGKYLYDLGIFPSPNVKGSRLDFSMQHDCYPFALYNMIAFWGYLSFEPYGVFCIRIKSLLEHRVQEAIRLLESEMAHPGRSDLSGLIEE